MTTHTENKSECHPIIGSYGRDSYLAWFSAAPLREHKDDYLNALHLKTPSRTFDTSETVPRVHFLLLRGFEGLPAGRASKFITSVR
jgi:hypothetical protein